MSVRLIGTVLASAVLDDSDLILGLATLERVLVRLAVPVEMGAVVSAAQRIFAKEGSRRA